jgi:cyclomaltodextrinase
MPKRPEPGWVRHAVWWQVYPLGFAGRDTTGHACEASTPDAFELMVGWLDYAVRLGVSGLALGPIFESETHGYDTVDHFRIDSRLGSGESFDRFVAEAKQRGLRLLLDGVFNHVGRTFSHGTSDWLTGAAFEGHDALVELNHANPEVVTYVAGVMNHWLDRGVDGWRLDAAYAVAPSFWAAVLPGVLPAHPAAWFVGEMIHGDYSRYVEASGLDSVTQYELWKAIWSSLADANLFELAWALDRHNAWLDTFVPLTFVGNHDVTRIASRFEDGRRLEAALAILFTLGGTPSVYYGDEQGFRGIKEDRPGGDDAVRPAFPKTEAELAPFGADVHRLHQYLIGARRRHPWLHRARTEVVALANRSMVYDSVDPDGEGRIRVTIDLDSDPSWVISA